MLRFSALPLLAAVQSLFAQESFPQQLPLELDFPAQGFQYGLTLRGNANERLAFLAAGTNGVVRCKGREYDPIAQASVFKWDSWTTSDLGMSYQASGVATSGTRYVAVGRGAAANSSDELPRFAVSTDGANWTGVTATEPGWLQDLAYGNGTWVAVGTHYADAAGFTGEIQYSKDDGSTWHAVALGEDESLFGVCWNGSKWVAVGEKRSSGMGSARIQARVYTSPDGVAWAMGDAPVAATLNGVAWGHGAWVAVGASNPAGGVPNAVVLRSETGETWADVSPSDMGAGGRYHGVDTAVSGFLVVGDGGRVLHSPDGRTWSSVYALDAAPRRVYKRVRTERFWPHTMAWFLADTGRAFLDTIYHPAATPTLAERASGRVALSVARGRMLLPGRGGEIVDARILRLDGTLEERVTARLDAVGSAPLPRSRGTRLLSVRTADGGASIVTYSDMCASGGSAR